MIRPSWPFTIGMLGGALFGIGALAFVIGITSASPSSLSLIGIAGGGLLLAVAWMGMLRMPGAFGAMLGSLSVPLAFAYVYVHRADWGEMRAMGMMVGFSLAALAAGHAFVTGLGVARVLAVQAALALVLGLFIDKGSTGQTLGIIGFLGLIGMGGTIPFGMMGLRSKQRADDPYQL